MSSGVGIDRTRRIALVILALLLVTTGSYIRTRTLDESDSVDWLVLVQLGLAMAGGFLGILLMRRGSPGGFGAKLLVIYIFGVFASGAFTLYRTVVFGYWILLAGTVALCMGLVSSSLTESSLREVENLILGTLSFMLLKDALLDAFWFAPQIERMDELGIEMYRYGMGSTSSNSMGLAAAIAFWMSFDVVPERNRSRYWKIFWRGLFAAIVWLTRARFALAGLLGGGIMRWSLSHWHERATRSYRLLVAIPCFAAALSVLTIMGWLWNVPVVTAAFALVNRGESYSTIMSVTGRTDIWPYALQRVFDGLRSIIFGHGYSTSKFVLNESNWSASFFAYHAHNTFLEVLLSTGLLGLLPFLAIITYSLQWVFRFSEVVKSFSLGFTLRAITVLCVILSSTMTESELAMKTGPAVVVFLFYMLSLDREAAFSPTTPLR